jgi:hypothetical protein
MLFLVLVVAVIGVALVGYAVMRNRQSSDQALTSQVVRFAAHDVNALTEQIRRVGDRPEAADDIAYAKQCEARANAALESAKKPEDMEAVSAAVAEGFYAVQCAQAKVDGQAEMPAKRPACYFDPAHGLSTTDVHWAPSGEDPATVPACARCAAAVAHNADPTPRMVTIGGMSMPHWRAPDYYDPWAAGFYGSAHVAA